MSFNGKLSLLVNRTNEMVKDNRHKFRDGTTRLTHWDYGSNASYFVTICTKDKECFFGEVKDSVMYKSAIGNIVTKCWFSIPQHFPFVRLDHSIVMPNHVHGIIAIEKEAYKDFKKNEFGPQSQNLASIIRGFKPGVTIEARKLNSAFSWQARYYDHVIKDKETYHAVVNYIINNPCNWKEDQFFH